MPHNITPFESWTNASVFDNCAKGKKRNIDGDTSLAIHREEPREGHTYLPKDTQSLLNGVGMKMPIPRTISVKASNFTAVEGCFSKISDVVANWCRTPTLLLSICHIHHFLTLRTTFTVDGCSQTKKTSFFYARNTR